MSFRHPFWAKPSAVLGQLETRKETPEATDPFLDRRLLVHQPPVLRFAETERLLLRQRQAANEPTESTQQARRLL